MTKKPTTPALDISTLEADLLSSIRSGKSLLGQGGVLTPFIKRALEAALEGEIDSHILEETEAGTANRRNGKSSKTLRSRPLKNPKPLYCN